MRNLSDEGRKFKIGEFRGLSEDAGTFHQTSLGEHATKKSKKEIWVDRVWCVFVYVYPLPGGLLWRGVVSPAGARVTTASDRATACKVYNITLLQRFSRFSRALAYIGHSRQRKGA